MYSSILSKVSTFMTATMIYRVSAFAIRNVCDARTCMYHDAAHGIGIMNARLFARVPNEE